MSRALIILATALLATMPASIGAAGAEMQTGSLTKIPIGHYEFCRRTPAECGIRSTGVAKEAWSEDLQRGLERVTHVVNRRVKSRSDQEIYGQDEVWAYPDFNEGDCEDYVLEKRRILADAGFALANLLITVVKKPDGEGHAVLTVVTDRGDLVLDNLNNAVKDWRSVNYAFMKRQSRSHTGQWVDILGGADAPVAAVRATN